MHIFCFQIFNPITLLDIRLFNIEPVRNVYVKTYNSWLLPHITIQPFTLVVNLYEHIILGCITSHIVKRHLQITLQISVGLALQLVCT